MPFSPTFRQWPVLTVHPLSILSYLHSFPLKNKRLRSMPGGKNLTSDKMYLTLLRIWRRFRSSVFLNFSSRPNINHFTGVGVFYWLDVLYTMPGGKNLTSDKMYLTLLRIWRRFRSSVFLNFSSRPNINHFTGVGVFYWLDVLYTMLPQSIFWLLLTRVSQSFLARFRRKKIRQNRYKICHLMT